MSTDAAVEKIRAADKARQGLKEEAADLHFDLGNNAFQKRDFETAIFHYQKTVQLRPSDAYAHHNLGIILIIMSPIPTGPFIITGNI